MRLIVLVACLITWSLNLQANSVADCENNQLEVTLGGADAGMSHWVDALEFMNKSAASCQLSGVPSIDLLTADRKRLPVPVCPNCGAYMFPAYAIRPVVLKPGEKAHALISSVTAYDKPLCGATDYVRVGLARGKPTVVLKSPAYSCVAVTVSPYLPGSDKGSDQSSNALPTAAPTVWGKPVDGLQLSLTSFAPEQSTGYLGFHVFLRGMSDPSSSPSSDCEKATVRIWHGDRLMREISSSDRLACVAVPPSSGPYPSMIGQDMSTAFFGTAIDEPGAYSFELVEQFKGEKPLTLISNRAAVVVLR